MKLDSLKPENELAALVNLLDEPDEKAFSKVREKLYYFGRDALPFLEHARDENFNTRILERIDEIIHRIRFGEVAAELKNWLNTSSSDLLKGYILVCKALDFMLDEDSIFREVEKIRMDAWLELNENLTGLENVKVLNHILFQVHAFEGNRTVPLAPENFSISSFLKNRRGSSLSLGMLYLIIAQKLNIPIVGVNLPQHFILAYVSEITQGRSSVDDVRFYINPFNKGSVFTRKEIELFISQLKIRADISYFAPCSNIDIIHRLVETLIFVNNQQNITEKLDDLEELKNIIESM